MPIRVQDLLNDERTIVVKTSAGDLNVTYQPSAFGADLEDRAMTYIERNRSYSSLAETLAALLVGWDITGRVETKHEDGSVTVDENATLPITLDVLRELPGKLLVQIQTAINEDMKPKPDELKNSGAGSQKKVK